MSRYAYVFSFLALTGCVRPPSYAPPAPPTPTAWKSAADSLAAAPAPVAPVAPPALGQPPTPGAWWTLFNDPILAGLEQQASAQNFSLQAALARVEGARANVRVAASYRTPLVTADPQVYYSRLSALRPIPFPGSVGLGVNQHQFYIPINASYEADVWGRVRGTIRAAEADAQVQEAARRTLLLSVTADAATYYFGVRGLDAQLAVLDTARRDRQRSLDLTRARFRAGVDNEIALHRAETELANVEASRAETQRQRLGLEASLATVLGQPASAFRLAPQAGAPRAAPAVPPTLPAALLARRPDLQQAERRLAAASARLDGARLARLPSLRLNGFVGPQSAQLGELAKITDSYTYYVGGGVSIPVFNGGRNRANEQVARSEADALVSDYRQAALVAFQEVETAQADVRQYQSQLGARQRALRAARQASALTKERYRAGLTNYFEVVDADRQTLDAATLLTQTESDLLAATVALVRALGGGWE